MSLIRRYRIRALEQYARGLIRHGASTTVVNSALGTGVGFKLARPTVAVFITANALISSSYWSHLIFQNFPPGFEHNWLGLAWPR